MELAAEHADRFTAAALSHRKPTLIRIGECYSCGEPFPRLDDNKISQKVFCDIECSQVWERRGAR